ncbi:DUF1501 domain-containing protein [Vulgatibacter sp.]|uniref:DUF1501 domain-containing protein n=1 Tax=Vulgatibacter sp. TaxID=1971226 RepID=UPI0035632143
MDRRDFLKLASYAGLSLGFPAVLPRSASAQAPYDGPLWVMVHAGGGWDPTSLCDPKGMLFADDPEAMNRSYLAADIGTAGNLRYAPVGGNQLFFEKYASRLLVLNGVDTETNSHDSGTRNVWSGKLAEGHPCFAALVAAAVGPEKPMSFLTSGGYDFTSGLVAPTRTGNMGALTRIAFPDLMDPANAESRFHTAATAERIAAAQRARLEALMAKQQLPLVRNEMNMLFNARAGENELRMLTEFLPATLDTSNNPLKRQAQVAIAGYRAGITVAANLTLGGFDTHGNHDAAHIPRLQLLLEGVDFLMTEAEAAGVGDRVVVVVGSDFGRTPGYNEGNGKDHWSVTSLMLMGPGIRGNRVIGSTDERHRPLAVNPETLQTDPDGVRIKPAHVHRALRRLAGIEGADGSYGFPLPGEDLPLFS